MQRSESRILTTHTGSLPRPKALVDLQLRINRGEVVDPARSLKRWTRRHVAQCSAS